MRCSQQGWSPLKCQKIKIEAYCFSSAYMCIYLQNERGWKIICSVKHCSTQLKYHRAMNFVFLLEPKHKITSATTEENQLCPRYNKGSGEKVLDTSAAVEEVCGDGAVCDVWGDTGFQAPKLCQQVQQEFWEYSHACVARAALVASLKVPAVEMLLKAGLKNPPAGRSSLQLLMAQHVSEADQITMKNSSPLSGHDIAYIKYY